MKKTISLLLILTLSIALVSCSGLDINTIRENLENAGYTLISPKIDDMEILQNIVPEKALSATNVLDSIAIFLYKSEKDAKKAMEIYKNAMKEMISMLIIGIEKNAFYIATNEAIVKTAFQNA